MHKKTQKNILCTWEIGGDLGHIMRMAKVVRLLEAQDYSVFVALHDLSKAHLAFTGTKATLIQAPVWLTRVTMNRPIACLADTLLLSGYLEVEPLLNLVRGWQSIVALTQPHLVIFDYAPTAMLAMHNLDIPKIKIGSGFAEPVPGQPIADWRPYKTNDNLIERQEQKVLENINKALQKLGLPTLSMLSNLFKTEQTIISVFDVIDPYKGLRPITDYCVGISPAATQKKCSFSNSGLPKMLAYVKNGYAHLRQVAESLAAVNAEITFVCPGGDLAALEPFTSDTFTVCTEVIDFANAFTKIDAFFGHGNANTVSEALYHGVPVFVLPQHLEQLLIGTQLKESGAGELLLQFKSPQELTSAVEAFLASPQYAIEAKRISMQKQALDMPLEERALDLINKLLSEG